MSRLSYLSKAYFFTLTNILHNLLYSNTFSKILLKWDKNENKREMPWKREKDPYRIWLSEIMLQQTRVEQGLKYYENFIKRFPTIQQLAAADDKEVYKLWEGLGYYSRCRNLLHTARFIVDEYEGIFPNEYEKIVKLKGIGAYTAAAIASFAYNMPRAVVDGNVSRILARIFEISEPVDSVKGKKIIFELAEKLLDKEKPAQHNQAIMDFGATICKPQSPLCQKCVLKKRCVAFEKGIIGLLPIKEKRTLVTKRYFYFFVIEHKSDYAVRERVENDIWRHLYEFPSIEATHRQKPEAAINVAKKRKWFDEYSDIKTKDKIFIQKLSHRIIEARFIDVKLKRIPRQLKEYEWRKKAALTGIPFPKIINEYLNETEKNRV
jgi:A/G-specific adenine glycosylase